MSIPDHISESLKTIIWVKILKFFGADADPNPGSGNLFDPGYGMEKIRIRDKNPGSATLYNWLFFSKGPGKDATPAQAWIWILLSKSNADPAFTDGPDPDPLTQVLKLKLPPEFIYKDIFLCHKEIFEMHVLRLASDPNPRILIHKGWLTVPEVRTL